MPPRNMNWQQRVGAITLVVGLVVSATGAPHALSATTPADCVLPGDSRCERWVARRVTNPDEYQTAFEADPVSGRVFSVGVQRFSDIVTVAHSVGGNFLWQAVYNGPKGMSDWASDVAVSPDGNTVVVAGGRDGATESQSNSDFVVIAYNATNGQTKWVQSYNGGAYDFGTSVAFDPAGRRVYVTGYSRNIAGEPQDEDFVTIALDSGDGTLVWATRDGVPRGTDRPFTLEVSPDGATVVTTGFWHFPDDRVEIATIAYDAITGHKNWVRTLGPPGTLNSATDLEFSPDGSLVHVSGYSQSSPGAANDAILLSYDTATGELRWSAREPICAFCGAPYLAVSKSSGRVFLTGSRLYPDPFTGFSWGDALVFAYEGASGQKVWTTRYDPLTLNADLLTVSHFRPTIEASDDGGRVFVTIRSQVAQVNQLTTFALDAGSGTAVWDARFGLPGDPGQIPATDPWITAGAGAVFVGIATPNPGTPDFLVLSYDQ